MKATQHLRNALLWMVILAVAFSTSLWSGLRLPVGEQIALAQSGGFTGQVTDLLAGQAIAGALVSAGSSWASTDANGRYALRLSPAMYEVHVRAEGYIGMSKTRQTVHQASIEPLDFEMVVESPSTEQRRELDKLFLPSGGPELSADELESLRMASLTAAAVSHLPSTIRVLMPDGIVVVMPMDEYVKGVVPREMPPYWPAEALKAQAVAARSYAATSQRHLHEGADVCTTQHCQVWGATHYETTDRAVDQTHNVAATYAGNIISAFYFGHCDGRTRNSEDVWTVPLPYLRSVECPIPYPAMFGHGVGMCQQGARVLAEQGNGYADILMHYYTDVQVTRLPVHILTGGRVVPEEGDTATPFTFEVVYASHDPPIAAHLYIDGQTYRMNAAGPSGQGGTLYRYSTALPAGTHEYAFHFENGYDPPLDWPASGTQSGPTVQQRDINLPTPTPEPTAEGTYSWQWTQSTLADFADGTHENTVLTSDGDGEVVLAPDSTFGVYTSTVKLAPIGFVAAGSEWQAITPAGTAITIALRSSADGESWSEWATIPPMDAEREETILSYGELLYGKGPYVQYRVTFASYQAGISPVLHFLTVTLIDSRTGPTAQQAQSTAITIAIPGAPVVIPRSAWGADESLFNWPPEYRTVRKFVIHHTATPNGDLDPAATVRAVYYYHAVTRGWGDIGYNYLIDAQGRIYEGRRGGEGVVGGHAKQYNWGSIGISFIGNYEEVDLTVAARDAVVEMIAWKGNLHFVDPAGHGFFIDQHLPNVMGHRDGAQTTCPGRFAYARLPALRDAAARRMAELPPNVRLDAPTEGERLSGVVDLLATASPAVTQVDFYVDGAWQSGDTSSPFSWRWNTTTAAEGPHELRAVARTAIAQQAQDTANVTVDNRPPSGSLSGPAFTNVPTIALTTQADDARWMAFSNGWHWEGEEMRHQTGRLVEDAAAWNGQAWMGLAASDQQGWWYGPYLEGLPTGRSYRVYFRLKTSDRNTSASVASIDVTDDFGRNTYISRDLTGQDFRGQLIYQEPYVDFTYYRHDDYGLEFRTFYAAESDLYLDRVYLFRAPMDYAGTAQWILPQGDGPKEVAARYVDAAGNVSPVYAITIVLDTEPPQWLGWDGSAAQVRDELSGLQVGTAEYAASSDGGTTWGVWRPAIINATEGTTATVSVSAPADGFTNLRFRIADRAGNLGESAVYEPPAPTVTATPSATATGPATATPTPTASPTATRTGTATQTATPSATLAPQFGEISGRVSLQGRSQHHDATVSISQGISVTTAEDGSFVLTGLSAGAYTVTVRMPGYLEAHREGVTVSPGAQIALPRVTLRGGDVNGDCDINLFDLVLVAANLSSPPRDERADLNRDGRVDLLDLVLVSMNLTRHCPSDWPQ